MLLVDQKIIKMKKKTRAMKTCKHDKHIYNAQEYLTF